MMMMMMIRESRFFSKISWLGRYFVVVVAAAAAADDDDDQGVEIFFRKYLG